MFKVVLFCFLSAALNVGGAAVIKKQLSATPIATLKDYIPFLLNIKVMVAFGIILASALVLFKALSMEKFSLVIPITNGINFSLTVLLGVFLFGDKLTGYHLLGLLLILSGIVLISKLESI